MYCNYVIVLDITTMSKQSSNRHAKKCLECWIMLNHVEKTIEPVPIEAYNYIQNNTPFSSLHYEDFHDLSKTDSLFASNLNLGSILE